MRRSIQTAATFAVALLLAACGSGADKPVGGIPADEAAQLDNAAEMLDASPDGLAAPQGASPANDAEGGNEG